METKLYNQAGEDIGIMEMPEKIFGVPLNLDLLHQVRVAMLSNNRKPVVHTKDRSEVSGGGRKPWRQKGTGRARHGSSRSPIWKGGGVSHGPRKDKDYTKKVNTKMSRLALKVALSSKFRNGQVKVIDNITEASFKTKDFAAFIKKISNIFGRAAKSTLFVLPERNLNILWASHNLPRVKVITAADLNVLDLLSFNEIILTQDAVNKLKV